MSKNKDVLIIGGGIISAAIAYYSSKAGVSVSVLEKSALVSGTSSSCDGNILVIDKDPGFDSQMTLVSQKLLHQLSKDLELPFEYRNPGSILVCESDEELIAANKWVELQKAAGLDFKMLDRQDLKNESQYFAEDLYGGLESPTDGTVNPYMLAYSMFNEAKKMGAEIHEYVEVKDVKKTVEGHFIVETSDGQYTANKVINAAGVWAPTIGKMLDLNIPILPRKGQIIVASRQKPVGMRKVMEFGYLISKFGGERKVDEMTEKLGVALVFEPTESQNFLIGSSREFLGFDTRVQQKVTDCIAKRALRFYPNMSDMTIIRTYAGLRPWIADHLPIISEVESIPGFYIVAGHEGDGIGLAAVSGKLTQEIIQNKQTSVPVEKLQFNRFNKDVKK